jgi:hypothetical protein
MRSESEIQWVRVKNNVGQLTKSSAWHVIIPGYGSLDVPPGTYCGVALVGSRTFAPHSGLRELDGQKHDVCLAAANEWIAGIDPEPGPYHAEEPAQELAPPG